MKFAVIFKIITQFEESDSIVGTRMKLRPRIPKNLASIPAGPKCFSLLQSVQTTYISDPGS
jgi:hypothetical protein